MNDLEQQKVRRTLDKAKIIDKLAQYASQYSDIPKNQLMQSLQMLNSIIVSQKDFPWSSVAYELEMNRWRLYHWYYETFQRMLTPNVSKEDQQIIKDCIREALDTNQPLNKQFQQEIKQKLSQDYHRSSFSISFNNQKRQVMREMGKDSISADSIDKFQPSVCAYNNEEELQHDVNQKSFQLNINFLEEVSQNTTERLESLNKKAQLFSNQNEINDICNTLRTLLLNSQ